MARRGGVHAVLTTLFLQDCSTIVFQPYRPLMEYAENFARSQDMEDSSKRNLMQTAWTVVNDSLSTDPCLLHPPYLIALGALGGMGRGKGGKRLCMCVSTRGTWPATVVGSPFPYKRSPHHLASLHVAAVLHKADLSKWFAQLSVNPSEVRIKCHPRLCVHVTGSRPSLTARAFFSRWLK